MSEAEARAPIPSERPFYTTPVRFFVAALGGLFIAAGGAPMEAVALPFGGVILLHLAFDDAWRSPRAIGSARLGKPCAPAGGAPASLRDFLSRALRQAVRQGMLTGLAAGFAANAASMGWAIGLFEEHAFLPMPLATLLAALLWFAQSLPFVLAGGLGAVVQRLAPSSRLVTPLALLLGGTLGPMFFPWRVGTSETGLLPLAAWASLGGVGLVDLALTVPSVLAAEAMRTRTARAFVLACAALALALGGGAALRSHIAHRREGAPRIALGLAHTTLTIAERHSPMRWEANHLALLAATAELEAEGAEVVLWPETSYAFHWPRGRTRDVGGIESVLSHGVHGPVVFGSITYDRHDRWNSVVGIDRDGARLGIVDKRVLMPFSERIPFYEWLTPWHDVLPGSLTPAESPGVLEVAGVRIGVLNCYEDLSDEHTRWLAQLAPSVLSNHTNDAWFGEHGAELHLFLSRMRAIETGRDLVRVVNGGVSAHIAWTGEVIARRGPNEPGSILADVHLAEGRTPYAEFGDVVGMSAIALYLALLVARRIRSADPPG